jgi:hypothetical protein
VSFALYANFTEIDGPTARDLKARIRNRIRREGGVVTAIYRNPFSPERHRYRFIRVHFTRNT